MKLASQTRDVQILCSPGDTLKTWPAELPQSRGLFVLTLMLDCITIFDTQGSSKRYVMKWNHVIGCPIIKQGDKQNPRKGRGK